MKDNTQLLKALELGANLINEKFKNAEGLETCVRITLLEFMDNEITLEDAYNIIITFVSIACLKDLKDEKEQKL